MAEPDVTEAIVLPAEPTIPAKPERRRSGWFWGGILGGLIAAGCGFALAKVIPGGWPIASDATLKAEVEKLTSEADALQAQVADLAAKLADAKLTDRLTALENKPAAADQSAEITALKDQIATLALTPGSGDGAAIKALQDQVAALANQPAAVPAEIDAAVKAAEDKLNAATAAAAAQAQNLAALAAWRQVAAALDSGAPYSGALADLSAQNLPAVLTDNAASGLPTLQSLRDAFPDAARAALEDARRADMGASWTDRIATFLQTQTGARSLTPREGNDPDAVLSRAEDALGKGDLTSALTEIANLPDAAKPALADWQAKATLRVGAADAVAALGKTLGQ